MNYAGHPYCTKHYELLAINRHYEKNKWVDECCICFSARIDKFKNISKIDTIAPRLGYSYRTRGGYIAHKARKNTYDNFDVCNHSDFPWILEIMSRLKSFTNDGHYYSGHALCHYDLVEELPLEPKPFDPAKPVQTRDGREARIICNDFKNFNNPLIALIKNNNEYESVIFRKNNGRLHAVFDNDDDLINIEEK